MIKDSLTQSFIGYEVFYVSIIGPYPIVKLGIVTANYRSNFSIDGTLVSKARAFIDKPEADRYLMQSIEQQIGMLNSMLSELKARLK